MKDWEYQIAKTPEMQRVQGIKQLGLSYLIYPSATHTRYEHSLGVAHLAGMVIDHLVETSPSEIAKELSEHRKTLRAVALLHDVGHAPLSHVLNDLVETTYGKSHEEISTEIIQSSPRILSILNNNKIDPENIVGILSPNRAFHIPYLKEMISGDIDVDRIDYLNRDGICTSTTYGIINYQSIVESMKVRAILPEGYEKTVKVLEKKLIKEDQGIQKLIMEIAKVDRNLATRTSKEIQRIDKKSAEILKECHIVLDSQARHSAIGLLMAREVMYPLVYRHPSTRAAEGVFTKMVEYCIDKNLIDPDIFYNASRIVKNCDKNILINDGYLESMIRDIDDKYTKEMLKHVDSGQFFCETFRATSWDMKRLRQRIKDIIYATNPIKRGAMIKSLLQDISEKAGVDYWYITMDILPIKEEKGLVNALIELPGHEIIPLAEASSIIHGLRNSPIENWHAVIRMPKKIDNKDVAYDPKIHDLIGDLFYWE